MPVNTVLTGPAGYRGMPLAELEAQYSPSSRVQDLSWFLAEYAHRSEAARSGSQVRVGLRYGTGARETLDYFPAGAPDAPLHVYVHGGYWQELSKDESAFAAPGFAAQGINFVALGYGLAPECSLDEIVAQVRGGLAWLLSRSGELGFDPRRVFLSGSSAGAHLVAMALLPGWVPGGGHPADLFAGAVLLSGIYDLEPLLPTYVNAKIGMDAVVARRNSPIFALPDRLPPVIVARGGVETEEFARQHEEFVLAIAERGGAAQDLVIERRNHFDLPFDLGDRETRLGHAVSRLHTPSAPRSGEEGSETGAGPVSGRHP
jgi:arylformamidase